MSENKAKPNSTGTPPTAVTARTHILKFAHFKVELRIEEGPDSVCIESEIFGGGTEAEIIEAVRWSAAILEPYGTEKRQVFMINRNSGEVSTTYQSGDSIVTIILPDDE